MDGSRMSDFSIERILSPQLGARPQATEASPDGSLHGLPGGFSLDFGYIRPPAPVPAPLPAPCCPQYRAVGFGEACYPCGAGFHPSVHFSSMDPAEAHLCAGYHGYPQAGPSPQSQHRQKARMRTVFTDSQTRQLEALFELTDYPAAEARAEMARRTGLSEETVRVWFKNRRARRKRQCNGSGVQAPAAEKGPFP